MFFGFQLTCGLMLVFYGYSVMKNPRVWGDQGRQAVKAENFPEYCRQKQAYGVIKPRKVNLTVDAAARTACFS